MADSTSGLEAVRLKSPVGPGDLDALEIGDVVYIDGRVHTGRESVYRKVVEEGAALPGDVSEIGNVNFHCSPAARVNPDGTYEMGAVTATASFRFAKWLDEWFERSQCKIIIGKGGMSSEVYREKFVPRGAVYLTTVGYGTGALLGRGIRRVLDAHWLDELGIAQALWVLDVENFGPFLVESDLAGNSLFEREHAKIVEGVERLYEGTRPAILGRYGETDRREDELI